MKFDNDTKSIFRKFMISIFLILSFSCANSGKKIDDNQNIKEEDSSKQKKSVSDANLKDTYKVVKNYVQCPESKKDELIVFFESNFEDDLIEITYNDSTFAKKVKTDPRLGLAKEIVFGRKSKVKDFSFKINGGEIVEIDSISCNFIFVTYDKNRLVTVDFSDKYYPHN